MKKLRSPLAFVLFLVACNSQPKTDQPELIRLPESDSPKATQAPPESVEQEIQVDPESIEEETGFTDTTFEYAYPSVHASSDSVFVAAFSYVYDYQGLVLPMKFKRGVDQEDAFRSLNDANRIWLKQGLTQAYAVDPAVAEKVLAVEIPSPLQVHRQDNGELLASREFSQFVYWEDEMGSSTFYSEFGDLPAETNGPDWVGISDPGHVLMRVEGNIAASERIEELPEEVLPLLPDGADPPYNWQIKQQRVGEVEILLASDLEWQFGSHLFIKMPDQSWEEFHSQMDPQKEYVFWDISAYPFLFQGKLVFALTVIIPDTDAIDNTTLYFDGDQYRTTYSGWLSKAK
ncbi:MAG TPA: hypothetical protein DCR93_07495 [Cytophagales bacterium]|nr:hypothetical protein [Cytophagales bacterium]HAP59341.1 hypothetical protein [Cytophagales bacterium]